MSQNYLVLDYETRSKADLKRCGAWEYSVHPSTQVLCVSWRLGSKESLREQLKRGEPAKKWSPALPSPYGEFIRALINPAIVKVAHNALFEQVVTKNVLSRIINKPRLKELSPSEWLCTASLARALALPGKLEMACEALKLPVKKDMEGHRLMLKMSKPRRATKASKAVWHSSLTDLKRLMEYCAADVDAETWLLLNLPPLHPMERKVWLLDQKINMRGFHVDRPLVESVLSMIDEEAKNLNARTVEITGGVLSTTNKRAKALEWLEAQDVHLPDWRAKTVADAIKEGIVEGAPLELLKIRQEASKTSTKKYQAIEWRSRSDSRVRDILLYCAAGTGRFGGMGVQPQNFPARGILKVTPLMLDTARAGDLELVRMLYGDPMKVFSSVLRATIKAPRGRKFVSGDYNAIEARVLFWIAGHEEGLKAFREGRPMYEEMAATIFNRDVATIQNPSPERDLGKAAILGAGFQMGPDRFREQCLAQGQEIDEELAEKAIAAYREKHWPVKRLWSNLEKAALAAVRNPGRVYKINRTKWWAGGGFLWCGLPSGRKLAYYGPEIRNRQTSWGEDKPTLHYWGVDPKTKKWQVEASYGGKLTENVVQAVARDLMVAAMIRAEEHGDYEVALTVHDELLAETENGSAKEFEALMAELPEWAGGLPVKVGAWEGPHYRK